MKNSITLLAVLLLLNPFLLLAAPQDLPLLSINDMVYEGAFRVPADDYNGSSMNYSEGPIEYNPDNHSVFLVGHSHHQNIAEFKVPDLVKSSELSELNISPDPLQEFESVLDSADGGNSQNINRIGGMRYFSGANKELIVNAYEYYDAPGDNSHTTLAIRDATDLAGSTINGYFSFSGGAGHTAGWISPIPNVWQSLLGGSFITGMSSGIPIIGRSSVGPSAFAFSPSNVVNQGAVPDPIPTVKLMDFSLENKLAEDLSNSDLDNDLWTHLSRVIYGMIVPGTRTYLTIGHSAGHESGVCYKCTQNNGNTCGGYCANDSEDYYHYYWFWDVNDFLRVKNGEIAAHAVRPYARGIFPTPFSTSYLGGGSFDQSSGLLYLTVQRADDGQGRYSNPPVIVAYSFSNSGDSDDSDGGGSNSHKIGKYKKKTVYCIDSNGAYFSRFDSKSSTGPLEQVRKAIRYFRRHFKKARDARGLAVRKTRRLKRSLKKARQCKSGKLFNN